MSNILGKTTINNISLSGETDLFINELECDNLTCNTNGLYYGQILDNNNLTNKLYVDNAVTTISGSCGLLSGNNIWTGTNSFNVNLPTSTITPTTANQLTTKTYVDSNFVNLTGSQNISGSKLFTSTTEITGFLIPRYASTGSLRIGNNSQFYQVNSLTNSYNITMGENSLLGNSANPSWNKCKRNIVIGRNAGSSLTYDAGNDLLPSDDNVIVGDLALQQAFYNSCQNVVIGSKCCQYNVSVKNNVLIGYAVNSASGLNGLANSVIIGASSGMNTQNAGSITCVGQGNGYLANSFTVFGQGNLTSATMGNRVCVLGSGNLNNISGADAFSCAIGNENGNSQSGSNSYYNCYIGFNNNVANTTVNGSITFGVNSIIPRKNCFYIGSNHNIGQSTTYQDLCIANKNTVLSTTETSSATYNISFENGEIINITANTTTIINLPTPSTAGNARYNIGCRFTIIKSYTPLTAITINAPSGQTLRRFDGTTGTSYNFSAYESYITLVCVGSSASGTNWNIINQLKTNSLMITYPSNSVPATSISGTLTQSQITNGYVDLVNNQNIAGIKTFSNDIDTPSINNTSGNTLNIGQGGSFVNVLGDLYAININPISPNTYVSSQGLDTQNLNTDTYTNLTIGSINQSTFIKSDITEIDFPYFDTVSAKTTGGSITFNDPIKCTSLNTSGSLTLTVGNSLTSQNFNGSTFIKNAIKLESYSALSGTTTLSTPLSSYYSLTTTANGTVNLPAITTDMEGIQITFIKTSASNTYTINRGGTDVFRFINSDSSATATSISMANRFTVLRMVATQGGIWNIILAQGFQEANTSLITTNSTITHPFFGAYSIGAHGATNITMTIPIPNVYLLGQRILFRRVAASTASVLSSNGVYPLNSFTTTTTLMTSAQYQCEIECLTLSNTPTYGWFIIRIN